MDKKIRAAAGNDEQSYDDSNWPRMEQLLDKHLPVNNERRRYFLLLLVFLVAIPSFFVMKNYFSTSSKPLTDQAAGQSSGQFSNKAGAKQEISNGNLNSRLDQTTTTITTANDKPSSSSATIIDQPPVATGKNNPIKQNISPTGPLSSQADATIETGKAGKGKRMNETTAVGTDVPVSNEPSAEVQSSPSGNPDKPAAAIATETATKETNSSIQKTQDVQAPVKTATKEETNPATDNKKKTPVDPTGKFAINFSAGPDISSVGFDKMGKPRLQYGIGVSYAITNRITARAGFNAGRKVYSADSTNYKTPYTSTTYNYKLYNIDADCYVYEIPVTLVYNFPATGKHNWFVSTGLSSYVMKKEKYVYIYKNPGGQTLDYTHTHRNENTHYFSVLNISGGYQYNLDNRLSFLAEPYIKLPLSGIGSGKVKLNSMGIMFGIAVKPFGK